MNIVLRPITGEIESLADVAYRRLGEAMLDGRIPPGERLVMDRIAEQFGISRTPVRDALLRLQQENLIEPTGKKGYIVRRLQARDATHVYEGREAVEGFAARRVAEIGQPAIDHVLKAVRAAESSKSDARGQFEANMSVHRAVVEATENPLLLDLFDDIWLRARALAVFGDFLARETTHVPVADAHQHLLTAFSEGADASFAAMREHIHSGLGTHQS